MDFQRTAAYRWEDIHYGAVSSQPVSKDEARALVALIFAHFDMPPPVLRFRDKGSAKSADRGNLVQLPDWALKRSIVLHECAHSLTREPGHKAQWVRNYIELQALFNGRDRQDDCRAARLAGLLIAPEPKFWIRKAPTDLQADIMGRL